MQGPPPCSCVQGQRVGRVGGPVIALAVPCGSEQRECLWTQPPPSAPGVGTKGPLSLSRPQRSLLSLGMLAGFPPRKRPPVSGSPPLGGSGTEQQAALAPDNGVHLVSRTVRWAPCPQPRGRPGIIVCAHIGARDPMLSAQLLGQGSKSAHSSCFPCEQQSEW